MNNQSSDVDVVVVGAGFAGLTVARKLKRGRRFRCCPRGRRSRGRAIHARTDRGACHGSRRAVGGAAQHHLLALAEELGVKTYPQYVEGEHILDIVGREARYREGEDLPLEPADLEEFNRLMGELDALAGKLDVAAPWTVAGADALDAQTFESWLLGATASEPARSVFRLIAQTVFCVEPGQLSLLNLLHYAAADEGIAHMISTVAAPRTACLWAAPGSWPPRWPRRWATRSS